MAAGAAKDHWDAVVVGASLAGCSTAMQLARAGAKVALVERSPRPDAYKRICTHYIQPAAIAALERLELLEPIMAAGGRRTHLRIWTRWGWIDQPEDGATPAALSMRREVMDPLVRRAAAETPGVELMLGRSVEGLVFEGDRVQGVEVRADGGRATLRATLVVGADGRASKVSELAKVKRRESPHNRFSYAAYVEEGGSVDQSISQAWMADPDWAARFPTDDGLTLYAVMPTMQRLPEFKRDLDGAFRSFMAGLPGAPAMEDVRFASEYFGKVSMPNVIRGPVAPGLALVGDAAVAADPLFGIGCVWAFQGGIRLADSVAPALLGSEPLERGLARYRRRHRWDVETHMFQINDYATGRTFNAFERLMYSTAVEDARVAEALHDFGARMPGKTHVVSKIPRILALSARRAVRGPRPAASTSR
jgi:menaquinone-9 beta-reductase